MRNASKLGEEGRVVYVAAEKFGIYPDRVRAWIKHHNDNQKPDYSPLFYGQSVNLNDPTQVGLWLTNLRQKAPKVRFVIIDTLARSMSGDENSSRDMGQLVATCERIKNELDCAVLLVHHLGKNASRGARGHSSLDGAVDAIIELSADKHFITLKNTKQNSLREFADVTLRLCDVDLGHDDDLDRRVTSCIVERAEQPQTKKEDWLKAELVAILKALHAHPNGCPFTRLLRQLDYDDKKDKGKFSGLLKTLIAKELVSQEESGMPYQITQNGVAYLVRAKLVPPAETAVRSSDSSESSESEPNEPERTPTKKQNELKPKPNKEAKLWWTHRTSIYLHSSNATQH